ncbi:PREDICTED: LOW QUALITY PROTEIN: barttin [Acanthisitta chloris]|uniref:LOW QUALITY PROTEIN: barttin n=1 Tax=Acanthisitta chloris TaxID=57068 RepID=UPI0004F0D5BA|nr:PREDICTED: LOW QUALITY PROTEIN: barttin [Acanthisitta chloris]
MAEEKTFRYAFIILGFFLVMTGMFIMSVEKPHIYITFCVMGVLLIAVGITWSMCQCYPKITFVPADLEAERFLDHKPMVLPQKDTRLIEPCLNQEITNTYEKSLPSYEQIQTQAVDSALLPPTAQPRPRSCSQSAVQAKAEVHREQGGAGDPCEDLAPRLETAAGSCPSPAQAPLASLLEEMDTPSLAGSVPGSPVPQSRNLPPPPAPASREQTGSPSKGAGEEDDLYYGLQEEPDALLKENDCLFEPEN